MHDGWRDAILGCLLGGAIGDAAGAAFEGMPHDPDRATLASGGWRLTDDTQLTLATCEAIVSAGQVAEPPWGSVPCRRSC